MKYELSEELSAPARPAVRLELVARPPVYSRPWYWPFEGKRLETIRGLRMALFFLAAGLVLRTAVALTLGLSDDEAWYWAISKRLDTSYAVHPPLALWLTHLSCSLFGDNLLGARFPALLCSAIGSFWLVRLVARMGWAKGADATALLALTIPLFFVGGVLNGPDLPLFALWIGMMETSFAIGMGYERGSRGWLRLGALAGLALLSKYTAVLACASALFWLLSTPYGRRGLRSRWPYAGLLVTLVLFSPVLAWNALHDWDSFRFHFFSRHLNSQADLKRWLLFWFSQALLFGPPVLAGWVLLVRRALQAGPLDAERTNLRFLAIWAVVPGAIFFIQPLYSPFKVHWALYAYVPIIVYAAKLSAAGLHPRLLSRAISWSFALTAAGLSCLYLPVVPLIATATGPTPGASASDITTDFHAWSRLRAHLARLPADVRQLPLVASRYQVAAQSAFALGQRDRVRLIPNTGPETEDWDAPSSPPARFIFVSDSRYADQTRELYPSYDCRHLPDLPVRRGSLTAREIYLELCSPLKASSADSPSPSGKAGSS